MSRNRQPTELLESLVSNSPLLFQAILFVASILAGCLGALTGLGGGVIIVPLLVLGFGVDLRYAVGISLICVIATSSGAAIAFIREGYTNVRIALFLEMATTVGALAGAVVAAYVAKSMIGLIFGVTLIASAYYSIKKKEHEEVQTVAHPWANALHLNGSYPSSAGVAQTYNVAGVPIGFAMMFFAGVLSALLGIGSGALKVLAMDSVMKIPFKVSTTTSNFMIGVTAAASSGVYLGRGYIEPTLAAPVMLGILLGSMLGARLLPTMRVDTLRAIFAAVIAVVGVQMIIKGFSGQF